MRPKVSCLILTYNEAARIRIALTHALKWADEVVVVDKGSTDPTCEIAHQMGARIYGIPFSKQGHENLAEYAAAAKHDWVWSFTPGEVPQRKLIDAGLAMMSDEIDAVIVPFCYYSFGVHNDSSPWSWSGQIRLYNRKRVEFTGISHNGITAKRVARLEPSQHGWALHQTHATAADFMRAHSDYMINEAQNGTPQEAMTRAGAMIVQYSEAMSNIPELTPQLIGWQIYWQGVALHAWERDHPGVPEQYNKRAGDMLLEEWL